MQTCKSHRLPTASALPLIHSASSLLPSTFIFLYNCLFENLPPDATLPSIHVRFSFSTGLGLVTAYIFHVNYYLSLVCLTFLSFLSSVYVSV